MHGTFQTLDVKNAERDLAEVYERVVRETGRVEITRDGRDETVVLISKAELDALERALDILADTDAVREMRTTLARLAALCARLGEDGEAGPRLSEIKTRLMAVGATHYEKSAATGWTNDACTEGETPCHSWIIIGCGGTGAPLVRFTSFSAVRI